MQVKTYAVNNSSGHTFYVMGAGGAPPDRAAVEAACREVWGRVFHILTYVMGCGAYPTIL